MPPGVCGIHEGLSDRRTSSVPRGVTAEGGREVRLWRGEFGDRRGSAGQWPLGAAVAADGGRGRSAGSAVAGAGVAAEVEPGTVCTAWAEPAEGPAAPGREDQRWTVSRVKTVIGRRFRLTCTTRGVRRLLIRNGWSCQVPARRAIERDDGSVARRGKEVWPCAEGSRR
ncbi:winged helix-turn-helix domain-containing protein [Streptomyces sp. NPDC056529]|uniref:helix-turn-helix domain-containing protein n=1 Tax=Streptomyces sp. NPDC056529 TaxID=3345855 RepID=UPI0036A891F6